MHSTRPLPDALVRGVLAEAAAHDPVLARRLTLLALIWQENYQTQASLVARTEARLGRGCFGQNHSLAFRRDMQTIKASLAQAGHTLRYSRQRTAGGYYIVGRPSLDPELLQAIRGAAGEVDPRQMASFAQMTPAQRLRLAAQLTNDLLAMATRRQQQEHPGLSPLEAQRAVLHRTYQLPG